MRLIITAIFIISVTSCVSNKKFTKFLYESQEYLSINKTSELDNVIVKFDVKNLPLLSKNVKSKCLPLLVYWESSNMINYQFDSTFYQNPLSYGVYLGLKEFEYLDSIAEMEISFRKVTRKFQYSAIDKTYYLLISALSEVRRSHLPISNDELINISQVDILLKNGHLLSYELAIPFEVYDENKFNSSYSAKYSLEASIANYEVQMKNVAIQMIQLLSKKLVNDL